MLCPFFYGSVLNVGVFNPLCHSERKAQESHWCMFKYCYEVLRHFVPQNDNPNNSSIFLLNLFGVKTILTPFLRIGVDIIPNF